MSDYTDVRDSFVELTVPDTASQEQIDDVRKSFDAGAITALSLQVAFPAKKYQKHMTDLYNEVMEIGRQNAET